MFTEIDKGHILDSKDKLITYIEKIMHHNQYPIDLKEFITNKCILTGGAIASTILGESINDFDLYIKTQGDLNQVLKWFRNRIDFKDVIKEVNKDYLQFEEAGKCWTANAITLKGNIQIIIRADMSIRDSFDWLHCKPYIDISSKKLFISEDQYTAIINKQLVLGSLNNIPAEHRFHKFSGRGWKIDSEVLNYLKLKWAAQKDAEIQKMKMETAKQVQAIRDDAVATSATDLKKKIDFETFMKIAQQMAGSSFEYDTDAKKLMDLLKQSNDPSNI